MVGFDNKNAVIDNFPQIGKNTGSAKPAVFMDCGFHAREWISHAFCQWFVKEVQEKLYVFKCMSFTREICKSKGCLAYV